MVEMIYNELPTLYCVCFILIPCYLLSFLSSSQLTFSLLSQLYCFGASSVLLPRGTALTVVSAVVVVGVRFSFSVDFRLDFFEKKHPIFAFSGATRYHGHVRLEEKRNPRQNVRRDRTYHFS